MLKFRFLAVAFLCFSSANAQNLIANGGFEETNTCTEYNKTCAPEAWFHMPPSKPISLRDLPDPYKGRHYETVVMENFGDHLVRRIFLYTRLLCPLEAGTQFKLTFFMNPAVVKTFKFGAVFSTVHPNLKDAAPLTLAPSLIFDQKSHKSKARNKWRKIEVIFTAKGGEEYLIFGNFDPKPMLLTPKEQTRLEIKFLFDEIELVPLSPNYVLCPDMEERLQAIYATNDRHTLPGAAVIVAPSDTIMPPIAADTMAVVEYDETPAPMDTETAPFKFVIPDIGFDFGKYALNTSANPVLETCAAQISIQHPLSVQISGFTDDVGSDAFNLDLSAKRAMSVKNWFVEKHGLSPTLFLVQGLGESNPIATNETETGRQANRRVEINFVK